MSLTRVMLDSPNRCLLTMRVVVKDFVVAEVDDDDDDVARA